MKPMALWGLALLVAGAVVAEPITTGTLIDEMVDLRGLVEFPEPFYKTVQFSSYDHQSVLPDGKAWFYNIELAGHHTQFGE